jgi:adenylate cyclase
MNLIGTAWSDTVSSTFRAVTGNARPIVTLRRLRLVSGLVMLTYVTSHMFNHILGLVSVAWADTMLRGVIDIWQSRLGTIVLYGAFLIHISLALRTIHRRREWRLPWTEWLRLWAGFSLPLLLITHVVGTRVATTFYGFEPNYERVVTSIITGDRQGWQVALLAPGWIHGCLGLWISLRHFPVFYRARMLLLAFMIAMPLLSALGFVRMVQAVEASSDFVARHPPPYATALIEWREILLICYVTLVIGAAISGWLRRRITTVSQ